MASNGRRKRLDAGTFRVLGIDPGMTGAMASLVVRPTVEVLDVRRMPLVAQGAKKAIVDARRLWEAAARHDLAVIEQVSSRPGQGVASTFKFGMAYGAAIASVLAAETPLVLVPPTRWKRHFGVASGDKEDAIPKATMLVPSLSGWLEEEKSKATRIAICEAVLIALYGAMQHSGRLP